MHGNAGTSLLLALQCQADGAATLMSCQWPNSQTCLPAASLNHCPYMQWLVGSGQLHMNVCTPSNHRCCRAGLHSHPVSRQAGAVTNLESDLALCLPPPQQLGSRAAEPCPVVAQAGPIAKWGSVSGLQAGDEKGVLKRRKKKKKRRGKRPQSLCVSYFAGGLVMSQLL